MTLQEWTALLPRGQDPRRPTSWRRTAPHAPAPDMPVVDASVVVDWVAPDSDTGGPARTLLDGWAATGQAVLGSRLLLEEVAHALLTGVRRQRWSGAAADRAFSLLTRLPVQLADVPGDLLRAYELSRRYDEHPIYDMVYLAMAERVGQHLVTADERLLGARAPADLRAPAAAHNGVAAEAAARRLGACRDPALRARAAGVCGRPPAYRRLRSGARSGPPGRVMPPTVRDLAPPVVDVPASSPA